ncbi:MAG TPA: cobalamin-binding protein [Chthoniobacterales bacterium]|jgi:iron complex transport system substrate-binding protein|nr:cobalamin-binding protein [Chthoniobacterales bacterium]
MPRIVSLLPAATEIADALGLMEQVVGVSHECDFPAEANKRPRVTHCPVHGRGLTSAEIDQWVKRSLRENGTIYTIDEPLMRKLRPDIVLTQKLCDVCAVGYGTVARLAGTLPGPPAVVNLEPTSLADIFDDIRHVADACGVKDRAEKLIGQLSRRVENVRQRAAQISHRPRCFLMEWIDPPFCSGHWGPELVEIAGGFDSLGRKHQPSVQIEWQQVLEARPEVIVLALCGYDIARAERDYELLRRLPGFDSLPAAQNGRIHLVNASAYFARPGPRIVDSVEVLAGILHPDEFPEFGNIKNGAVSLRKVRRKN